MKARGGEWFLLDHVHMVYICPQKMKVRGVGGAEMKVMDPSVTHPLVEDDGPPGPLGRAPDPPEHFENM